MRPRRVANGLRFLLNSRWTPAADTIPLERTPCAEAGCVPSSTPRRDPDPVSAGWPLLIPAIDCGPSFL